MHMYCAKRAAAQLGCVVTDFMSDNMIVIIARQTAGISAHRHGRGSNLLKKGFRVLDDSKAQ
jgi:hypothetical protein